MAKKLVKRKELVIVSKDELEKIIAQHFGLEIVRLQVETSLDYSDCYYEGDAPSSSIENIYITYEKEE